MDIKRCSVFSPTGKKTTATTTTKKEKAFKEFPNLMRKCERMQTSYHKIKHISEAQTDTKQCKLQTETKQKQKTSAKSHKRSIDMRS